MFFSATLYGGGALHAFLNEHRWPLLLGPRLFLKSLSSPSTLLHFLLLQFLSSTEIAITKVLHRNMSPDLSVRSTPWRAEPGPLKLVAIDTGTGVVQLNPEDGGVVVATVLADVSIQSNENLHIYQSTKEVQVLGTGFDNDIRVSMSL